MRIHAYKSRIHLQHPPGSLTRWVNPNQPLKQNNKNKNKNNENNVNVRTVLETTVATESVVRLFLLVPLSRMVTYAEQVQPEESGECSIVNM